MLYVLGLTEMTRTPRRGTASTWTARPATHPSRLRNSWHHYDRTTYILETSHVVKDFNALGYVRIWRSLAPR